MTNEQKNVPELRFPEFEEELKAVPLSRLGEFKKSYSFSRSYEGNGDYGYIHYGDIHSKFPSVLNNKNLIPNIKESKEFQEVQQNDLIFADASEDYKDLGKAVLINFNISKVISGLHTHLFRPNNLVIPKFLLFNTKTKNYLKFIHRQGNGISVLGISKNNLSKYIVNLPFKSEQEKIGNFFSKLDRQIELEEQKLELLKQQKKGYMQKIFSQEIKFKDENGNDYPEWIEKTIEEVTKYISSKKSSNQYIENNTLGSYPVYDAIQEIAKDSQYDMEEPYISILKDGAGVGRLNLRAGKSSVIGTMGYLLPKYIDIQFLYYRMKLLEFKKYIIGSTIPHLYYKDYSKEKLKIPSSSDEQKKIGTSLKKLDDYIEKQSSKVEFLKQRKQGLLQKMFI
ncbi:MULTISPECIES: restriction endonuclease subunit S [Staphylococcus]|nr:MULTISPECIES: restriction endonuclease subunit S [Staphylococcus]AMG63838.1 restriction endonuclease subunit S [Staphylococcus lugdunensis]MCI2814885.1 restriction endonuclease subunit S [Staphylococcus lugdunensis]MDU0966741.1 restriction endonuclease subunit S [Staphylococcus lugdunensis]MDU1965728.1 restriction endonuclease subunit S [Staphylococcus lugdunensis]MDU2322201.1 restriction endonuclease subunit S [Staphylococcus lugdunensis]